jgi:hypothetical protein
LIGSEPGEHEGLAGRGGKQVIALHAVLRRRGACIIAALVEARERIRFSAKAAVDE